MLIPNFKVVGSVIWGGALVMSGYDKDKYIIINE